MGCASSNPLAEGGKNLMDGAKNATDNVMGMGEKAMQDASEAVNTGIDHVKSAVESGIQTAQNSIGTVIHNVEDTLGMAKDNVGEAVTTAEENVHYMTAKANNTMEETISDAKTVLAFEDATSTVEQEIEALEAMEMTAATKLDALKDEFGETVEAVDNKMEETLHIEDIDEMHDSTTTSPTVTTTDAEDTSAPASQQEQLTPWEAAADNIRKRRISETVKALALEDYVDAGADADVEGDVVMDGNDNHEDDDDFDVDGDTYTSTISTGTTSTLSAVFTTAATINSDVYETSTTASYSTEGKDYVSGNTTSDILLSDTISIKSYKSEI